MRPGETPVFFFEAGLGSLNSKGGRIWLFFGGGAAKRSILQTGCANFIFKRKTTRNCFFNFWEVNARFHYYRSRIFFFYMPKRERIV